MLEELGLKLIRIDLPFRLDHVNCFIAEGEDGRKIIDTGLHDNSTVQKWSREIGDKPVTDILITHYHPDHYGYAGGLQQKTGAKVWMSKIDANAGTQSWKNEFIREIRGNYTLAGIPEDTADRMTGNTEEFVARVTPYPTVNHYFQEGEMITIGNGEYEVIFTPGHSDGLVNFYNSDRNILLSTDHVLPKITPNISYWFHGDPNPLASYLKSLKKIKAYDAEFVIPSHGKPFYGANDRIAEIEKHHDDRLAQTLQSITGRGTVYEVCQNLFRKNLNIHEMRFAIGETLAHLEYLRLAGECSREILNGKWLYFY